MIGKTAITHFMNGEHDQFKESVGRIIEQKAADCKLDHILRCVESVFENKKSLNNREISRQVIDVLRESIKQKSNISLVLEDASEVILTPTDSENVLLTFDRLNENNQISIIENLISSQIGFTETVVFCSKYKRKAH